MQSSGVARAADLANADNPVEQRLYTGRKSVKTMQHTANGGKNQPKIYNAARSTDVRGTRRAPAADFRAAAGQRAGQVAAEPAFTYGASAAAATCVRRCITARTRPQLLCAEEVGVGGRA
jgi:hypothetical protein